MLTKKQIKKTKDNYKISDNDLLEIKSESENEFDVNDRRDKLLTYLLCELHEIKNILKRQFGSPD